MQCEPFRQRRSFVYDDGVDMRAGSKMAEGKVLSRG
jgi:hypothetical protein